MDCRKKHRDFGFASGGAGTERVQFRWCLDCASKPGRQGATSKHRHLACAKQSWAASEAAARVDLTASPEAAARQISDRPPQPAIKTEPENGHGQAGVVLRPRVEEEGGGIVEVSAEELVRGMRRKAPAPPWTTEELGSVEYHTP